MRSPDVPGEYRIRESNGTWRVSGIKRDGSRVKAQRFASKGEADTYVALNFETVPLDEWGLPASPQSMGMPLETAARVSANLGIPQPVTSTASTEDEKTKKERLKRSQGLMELLGMGWAAGTVMLGKKVAENAGKEPVNPSPKQVNDLADSAKDTLQTWFGERDIKPWQMTILLTLGIPIAIMIQSKPKDIKKPALSSVP
jgi:hypothetical protein